MTFNQLNYTLALLKYKNFKRAAEHVGISQPALSLQLQKLEEEIGIKLFNRASSPIEETSEGARFIEKAQEIVSGMRQLENFAVEISEDYSGKLKVGIIPTLAPFLVPLFSPSIQESYPRLQLVIKELITEDVVNGVRNGELDVGIISTPIKVSGVKHTPLFFERFYIYTSHKQEDTSNKYRLEDINYKDLWLLDEGNCFRDQVNDFCNIKSIRKDKKFIYQSNSIDALMRIVDNQGGTTILPELSTLSINEYQEENLKTISGRPKAREISSITRSHHQGSRYLDILQDFIKKSLPKHMLEKHDYEIVDPNIQMR